MLDVPGKKNAGNRDDSGQQDQRQADAICREMIFDAERRNPGYARNRHQLRRSLLRKSTQRHRNPAMAVSNAMMRAARTLTFGSSNSTSTPRNEM